MTNLTFQNSERWLKKSYHFYNSNEDKYIKISQKCYYYSLYIYLTLQLYLNKHKNYNYDNRRN